MKFVSAIILICSSTLVALPQLPQRESTPLTRNLLTDETEIITFAKASTLLPKNNQNLLFESFSQNGEGNLVVRDIKAKNYYVVTNKKKDILDNGKLRIGSAVIGSAVVYKATRYTKVRGENKTIGHPVALKRYSEPNCFIKDFPIQNEARALEMMGLDEGRLIRVETGEKGCFLAMKLMPGNTLYSLLRSGKVTSVGDLFGRPQSKSSIVGLIYSILRELIKVQDRGIIHRDFNFANVLIDDSYYSYVSISDFGNVELWNSGHVPNFNNRFRDLYSPLCDLCLELIFSFESSNRYYEGLDKVRPHNVWPEHVVAQFQKENFTKVISKLLTRYRSFQNADFF